MADEYDEIEINEEDEMVPSDLDDGPFDENTNEQVEDNSFFSYQLPDSALCVSSNPVNPLQVCVGCLDNSARLIEVDNAGNPQLVHALLGHEDSVTSVQFSPDGRLVATGSYDKTIRVWSSASGDLLGTIDETGSDIEAILFHPVSSVLVAGCVDGSVWVWQISGEGEATLEHMLQGHTHGAGVRTLNFLGKGSQGLLSTSEDGVAIVWNLKTGEVVHKTKSFADAILSASVHPVKPLYAVGLERGDAYVLHAESGKVLHRITTGQQGSIESVKFSACGSLLAVGTLQGVLEIWHMDQLNGYPRHKIDLKARLISESEQESKSNDDENDHIGITSLVWHPDQSLRCLISGGKGGRVDLWNAMTGEHLGNLPGHSDDIMDLAVVNISDPQNRQVARVVSVCDAGTVKMFTVSQD